MFNMYELTLLLGPQRYFQNPISTTVHMPIDIAILEPDDSSENTCWESSVGN